MSFLPRELSPGVPPQPPGPDWSGLLLTAILYGGVLAGTVVAFRFVVVLFSP